MDPWCWCLQGSEGRDLEVSFLNGCHSIAVQAKASGRGRYLVRSSIWSPTDLFPSWSKVASVWMLMGCSDPGSIYRGPVCRWDLLCLVPRLYIFASSFDQILVVFPLEERKKIPLGIYLCLFYKVTWKTRKKTDQLTKGQNPNMFLPPPPYQPVLPLWFWAGLVVSMAQWMGTGLRPKGFLLRPNLSPALWYWAVTWLPPAVCG